MMLVYSESKDSGFFIRHINKSDSSAACIQYSSSGLGKTTENKISSSHGRPYIIKRGERIYFDDLMQLKNKKVNLPEKVLIDLLAQ